MKIDFDKIIKIHGAEYMELINVNMSDVKSNITYLFEIGFNDVEDIFERYTSIFIMDSKTFKERMKELVRRLGINYIDIIENNLGILEELI